MAKLPTELARARNAFVDYLKVERDLSPATVDAYLRELGRYLRFVSGRGIRTVSQIRPTDVDGWLTQRQGAPSTVHRALSAVKHFHRFCVRDSISDSDPAALVEGPRRKVAVPKALTVEDTLKVIEAANATDPAGLRCRALVEILYGCGLRISEAVGLDLDDVDTEAGTVLVTGKGRKQRVVPMGEPAMDAYNSWLYDGRPAYKARGTAAVFLNSRGGRLSRVSAWKIIGNLAHTALGRRVHPHVLRHSFATHLLAGGADLRVVGEALGHASISTTQVYTRVGRDTLSSAVEDAHPLGSRRRERPEEEN